MMWTLADGTVVHLGGEVEGASEVARELQGDARRALKGAPDLISYGAQPGSWARLDLDNPTLVNIWVRTAAARARVAVVTAPEVERPEDDRAEDAGVDDDGRPRVY